MPFGNARSGTGKSSGGAKDEAHGPPVVRQDSARVYVGRTPGRHRHHRHARRPTLASGSGGPRVRQTQHVPEQSEADGTWSPQFRERVHTLPTERQRGGIAIRLDVQFQRFGRQRRCCPRHQLHVRDSALCRRTGALRSCSDERAVRRVNGWNRRREQFTDVSDRAGLSVPL